MSQNKFLRTCLVTGKKAAAKELQRFTIQDDVLVFDTDKKISGRGGYVLNDPEIIKQLPKLKKKIRHFLKIEEDFKILARHPELDSGSL